MNISFSLYNIDNLSLTLCKASIKITLQSGELVKSLEMLDNDLY